MATNGQFSWPSVGSSVAAYGQFFMAANTQSLGRVPDALASSRLKRAWEDVGGPLGLNHQLSIPLQLGGGDHHAYLIYRPDRDFTEQELALARLLQPILTGLALHLDLRRRMEKQSGAAPHKV